MEPHAFWPASPNLNNRLKTTYKQTRNCQTRSHWSPLVVRFCDADASCLLPLTPPQVTPDRQVYLHREAYVRTSSTPYNLSDLSDKAAHLTNDAVQKKLDTYHQFEDHCKMDMTQLQAALGPGVDLEGRVW
jgi:hypothetical protein